MRQLANPSELLSSQYFSRILKSERLKVGCLRDSGKILVWSCWICPNEDPYSCSTSHLDHSVLHLENKKKKIVIVRHFFFSFFKFTVKYICMGEKRPVEFQGLVQQIFPPLSRWTRQNDFTKVH